MSGRRTHDEHGKMLSSHRLAELAVERQALIDRAGLPNETFDEAFEHVMEWANGDAERWQP